MRVKKGEIASEIPRHHASDLAPKLSFGKTRNGPILLSTSIIYLFVARRFLLLLAPYCLSFDE